MDSRDLLARRKNFIIRLIRERLSISTRWRSSKEFKSWIEGLSERDFEDYIVRLESLTASLVKGEMVERTGQYIPLRNYPADEMKMRTLLAEKQKEASAYYALALWRTIEANTLADIIEAAD